MKLYLNSNIAEGTPEELVTYKELLKERGLDSEKSLFHFGHMHQLTEEEADEQEVDNSVYDKGAFYTVTEEAEDSPLPVGAILQHQHGNLFIDSLGQRCRISRPSFVKRGNTHNFDDAIKQDRFELAKELGILLTSSTDFSVETSDRKLKLKKDDGIFAEGELVKIVRDDNDRLPLVQSVEDPYRKEDFVYIRNLEFVQDTFKGIFGSLKIDKSSIESTESSTDEEQTPSRDLKVGDRVKVLRSNLGAEGEATVTAVLKDGDVEIAGTSKAGRYLYNWANHEDNLEKIEADTKSNGIRNYTVDSEPTAVQYYKVEDDSYLHPTVKQGTVVKKTGEDKTSIVFETSTGLSQIIPRTHLKLLDTNVTEDRFKFAKEAGVMLTVDTDFAEECKGHYFKVTEDECLSNFTPTDILTVSGDDGSNAIAFQDLNNSSQFTLLIDVKEVARPSK